MESAGLPELAIETFDRLYAQLLAGETGLIPEAELEPADAVPDVDELPPSLADAGRKALGRCVMIKLNGGLGTSMGLARAKSLLTVKRDLTFLDVVARHALSEGVRLVLMNSFSTEDDSRAALRQYPQLGDRRLDFLQHRVPKIATTGLGPIEWPTNPALEWNPPGHGDLFTALQTSGMLETLLSEGRDLAFVSNADNLGASIDPRLLGHVATGRMPFLMEVADRTEADRKGGHLARSKGGELLLREAAQCSEADALAFQDVERYRYFNTNNIWLDLVALRRILAERQGVLELPLIRNEKPVDPRSPESPSVFQLETAMGSAIGVLPGAAAVRVARDRFAPVKTTDDLLAVRADANVLTEDFRITPDRKRDGRPVVVKLDPRYFGRVDQLESRFPCGPPSLVECDSFVVEGDVSFGHGVRGIGAVLVRNTGAAQFKVEDGAVLGG